MSSTNLRAGSSGAYAGLAVEVLEERLALTLPNTSPGALAADEVEQILERAAAASASEGAIIAIVDRQGIILGVRVEQGVLNAIPDINTLIFAIDGAVALARTGAFFANDQGPLTSRTVEALSQSTITQREVESSPNIRDINSTVQGPGIVGAIGTGGHFPPGIRNTGSADLFGIEQTNRDGLLHPGFDGIKGTADDIVLPGRFNEAGIPIAAPESYGVASGLDPLAQGRGIGTLPGGIPIYDNGVLVGGIGVFFPGTDGFATHEQGFVPGIGQTKAQRINAPQVLEAEWIAFAAAGGNQLMPVGDLASSDGTVVDGIAGFGMPSFLPDGRLIRIDLVGITLDLVGPNGVFNGLNVMQQTRARVGVGNRNSGADQMVNGGGDLYLAGTPVPSGWLVAPKNALVGSLTQADVIRIVQQSINEANLARAQIRGLMNNSTKMVFAVADLDGTILGLFRMPDATYFSIDVAVAKARNTAYYNNALALQAADQLPGVVPGTAFNNRTFRYLAQPSYPEGLDNGSPAFFSSLLALGIDPRNGENLGPALAASVYMMNTTPTFMFTSFTVGRNFHFFSGNPMDAANTNGVVYFPGSTSVYVNGAMAGGYGASGDGVDQDDIITFYGSSGYFVPPGLDKADEIRFRGQSLPLFRFPRNAHQK